MHFERGFLQAQSENVFLLNMKKNILKESIYDCSQRTQIQTHYAD